MSAPKRSEIQIERDRETITELSLKGWTQQRIADYLELSQSQVNYDLKKIRKSWLESSNVNINLERKIAMKKLELIEREAWGAWDRSQQPEVTELAERINETINKEKVSRRSVSRVGDPNFLAKVLDVCKERHSILGLNQTKPTPNEKPDDIIKNYVDALGTSVLNMTDEQIEKLMGVH